MQKTLLILSHSNIENSKLNKTLINEVKELPITIRHLEKIYGNNTKSFDIQMEQKFLLEHDRIIFQFPLYWFSTPPLLKAYQDEILTYGFAYGSNGDKLRDKLFKVISTIGGPKDAYGVKEQNRYTMNELLRPLQAMADFTNMIYTKAFLIYGALNISDDELTNKALKYKEMFLDKKWNK